MQTWQAARRIALKARYIAQRAGKRLRSTFTRPSAVTRLDDVHRRLELVLAAVYGRSIVIAPAENRRSTRASLARGWVEPPSATLEGETIRLPAVLDNRGDSRLATDRYRLLAIEQAERLARGTPQRAPSDTLERDLYLLREGAAIDARISIAFPGLSAVLRDERAATLAHRPKTSQLTATERDVEQLLRETLGATPDDATEVSSNPEESLEWARVTATRLRRSGDRYRGLPLAPVWGTFAPIAETRAEDVAVAKPLLPARGADGSSGATSRPELTSESDSPTDEPQSSEQVPRDDGTEHDEQAGDQEAPASPQTPPSDAASGSASRLESSTYEGDPDAPPTEQLPPAIFYDEWNVDRRAYVRGAAAVRVYEAVGADPTWLKSELRDRAATVRQIRQSFERLRARRALLPRQHRGDALDLAACVDATIARRLGDSPDDKLYLDARPARRGLAISLLIDASGSTEQRVTESSRIIDIEKIAGVLALQALEATGDLYSIYAFSGRHASNVKVTVVKDFGESNADPVLRRIAGLEPDGFTRLGAVVRHATRELVRQSAGHRLLLLLSDGRPNDIDVYQGPYGVEDARQAILEARASGVFPYCITIDKAAAGYLPRIFGQAGHTVLQRPEQLPRALLAVVRGLIKR